MKSEFFEGEYEGWVNQATWAVALRIDNDRHLYERMLGTMDLEDFLKAFCRQGYKNADLPSLLKHFNAKRKEIYECRIKKMQ